jgi:hypothetical protein
MLLVYSISREISRSHDVVTVVYHIYLGNWETSGGHPRDGKRHYTDLTFPWQSSHRPPVTAFISWEVSGSGLGCIQCFSIWRKIARFRSSILIP